jgi:hypothetical protein
MAEKMQSSWRLQRQQKVMCPKTTSNNLPDTFFLLNTAPMACRSRIKRLGETRVAIKSPLMLQPKALIS